MDIFTNREIATIIWITLFIVIFLFNKQIRTSILNIIKRALKIEIILYFYSYLCYLSLIIYSFYYLELWDITYLKENIIWFVFSGLPIGLIVVTNKIERGFWKSLILKNLTLIVFVEFIISSFTFSLIVELLIIPIITLIVLMNTVSKFNEEFKSIEKFTNIILTFFGFFILSYYLYRSITEIHSIGNVSHLKSFLFPVVFSIISIPYMYIFKLIVEYEQLFMRLRFGKKRSGKLNLLIKLRLLLFCNIQIKKLQIAANMNNYNLMSISSKDEIDIMIRSYKEALSRETPQNSIILKKSY